MWVHVGLVPPIAPWSPLKSTHSGLRGPSGAGTGTWRRTAFCSNLLLRLTQKYSRFAVCAAAAVPAAPGSFSPYLYMGFVMYYLFFLPLHIARTQRRAQKDQSANLDPLWTLSKKYFATPPPPPHRLFDIQPYNASTTATTAVHFQLVFGLLNFFY